jgi:hypothetical protein
MKKSSMLLCVGVLMSALCAAFTACNNEPNGTQNGLGVEIPGIETQQATGTVIGRWADTGYGSFFLEVDEEFPIGEIIDTTSPYYYQGLSGIYHNVIQVQHVLPVKIGDRISFSCREYQEDVDFWSLFVRNSGTSTTDHVQPSLPIFVITDYKIIKD